VAARLKVYRTAIGFHQVVVAAPNQGAALKAWDVADNLFANGTAEVTDDTDAVEAALASPGVVLRRPVGKQQPWMAVGTSADLPDVPRIKSPKASAKPSGTATKPTKTAKPKPASRAPVDRAEAALKKAEVDADKVRDDYAARLSALEDKARAARKRADDAVRDAAAALKAARHDWRREGGED